MVGCRVDLKDVRKRALLQGQTRVRSPSPFGARDIFHIALFHQ